MKCANCQTALLEPFRFCGACGAEQPKPGCPGCGADVPAGVAFCPACGTRQPGTTATVPAARVAAEAPTVISERRLASVLFADLVSYTTLAESRDTEDVRALLSEYFEACKTVIGRYGGVVEKFIGDAVMAVWGVPTAHEDDAQRAVRAGLSLLDAIAELGERLELPQLAMRVGVVTGEVSTPVGAVDQGMVAGDPVNAASRVQSAAGPGEVWVDETTRNLAAATVAFVEVGHHALKGKAEAVELFRASAVMAVAGDQRIDGLEAPLTGRDRELRMVKELFHATEENRRPRLVVLDGEAGLGKSRLAAEFSKYIDGVVSTSWWHQGRCLSYGEGVSYWALAEIVRTRLGIQDAAGAVDEKTLDERLARWIGDEAERAWVRPRLASLIGAPGDFDRDDLYAAWTRFFERMGAEDPVILLIDDGQYADQGLLGFLEFLLANANAPIFVLLPTRPELHESHPDLGGRRATMIRLEPLPEPTMAALVEGLVADIPDSVRDQIVGRADGVPLYAVETVRALVDRDLVVPRGGRYVVADGATLDLSDIGAPSSLQALISARLDALTPDERRVVSDASVLGIAFTRDGIGVLSSDVAELDGVLASLQRKEILSTDTNRFSAEQGLYRFVQSVVRQVAYSILSRRDRKERHLRVADYLAAQSDAGDVAVVVATHLLDAAAVAGPDDADTEALNARAVELLQAAAERARSLGSHADGLRLYTTALGRAVDPERRARLQIGAAEAAYDLGYHEQCEEHARAAVAHYEEQGDLLAVAEPVAMLGNALRSRGQLQQSIDVLLPLHEQLARLPGSDPAHQPLLQSLANAFSFRDVNDPEAALLGRQALEMAERLGDGKGVDRALVNLAIIDGGTWNAPTLARAALQYVARSATDGQNWRQAALAHHNLGDMALGDQPRVALDHGRDAIAIESDHGLVSLAAGTSLNMAAALWLLGEWDELLDLVAPAADEAEDPFVRAARSVYNHAAFAAGSADSPPPAESRDLADVDDPQVLPVIRLAQAYRAGLAGDVRQAVELAVASAAPEALEGLTRSDASVFAPLAGGVCFDLGDASAARQILVSLEQLPERRSSPGVRAHLRLLRGRLALVDGDLALAESELVAAVAAFTSYDSPPNRGQASEFLAATLLRRGETAAAQPYLDAARETYTLLGATNWLVRLDALAASGDLART